MTAKEIKERQTTRLGSSTWVEFTEDQFNAFCKQLCKEQRHECQIERNKRSMRFRGEWYIHVDDIENAKQPEV